MTERMFELANKRILGDGHPPYIVAEMNSSHRGSMETAKKMIIAAKGAGADCVKFQSWSSQSLYSSTYYRDNPISERVVKKFALSFAQQKELAEFCAKNQIDFASTPYSEDEVDFLIDECHVPFIKIASMEINNPFMLEYIAKRGISVMLSTGMADYLEVDAAVKILKSNGCRNLALFHCVSIYPAKPETIQLNNILEMRRKYPEVVVGFSDHSLGYELASASIALGAGIIEKHMTLDKSKIGMDNGMAMEPKEFADLVRACQNVYEALGSAERVVTKEEQEQKDKMRTSLIFTRRMKKGDIIEKADISAKRPGIGIPPTLAEQIVGKYIARDVEADFLITEQDIADWRISK